MFPDCIWCSDCSDRGMWLAEVFSCHQILLPFKAEGNISRVMMSEEEQRISWMCRLVDLWTPEEPIGVNAWWFCGFIAEKLLEYGNHKQQEGRQAVLVRTHFMIKTAKLCFSSLDFFQKQCCSLLSSLNFCLLTVVSNSLLKVWKYVYY